MLAKLEAGRLERIHVGVIGVGRMGARHARNAARIPGVRVVGLADPQKEQRERLREELEVPWGFDDYRDLVYRDDVDAVIIAAPAEVREPMIDACIDAGKHIFCEKPVAVDLDTTRRIRQKLAGQPIKFQLGFMRRFDRAYARAYGKLREGAIGEPVLIRLTSRDAHGPSMEYIRTSGGFFVDSSVHDFDLARWLMDDEVARVFALGGCFVYPEYGEAGDIDVGAVSFSFRGSAIGLHDNARRSGYGYDIRTEIQGTEGCLQIGYFRQHRVVVLKDGHGSQETVRDFLEWFGDAYMLEMEHFIDCLRDDQQPSVGVEDGERALEIALAALTSLRTGQPCDLPGPSGAAAEKERGVS